MDNKFSMHCYTTTLLFLIAISISNAQVIFDPQENYDDPSGLFDVDSIREIRIDFYDNDYDEILDENWRNSTGLRLPAKISFSNGVTIDSVGIRYKGNSTYSLARDANNPKLPLNIDIDTYDESATLFGYKKLKLANAYLDPTFCREVTAYDIYQKYLPSSEANYIKVYIDSQYLGLYINTESVNKQFLDKHFGENDGVLFKCDPIQQFGQNNSEEGSSDLLWLGTDSTEYYKHYQLKSEYGWKELMELIDILNNDPEKLPTILNIDRVLWAFATNMVISNLDTYNGLVLHNYYLYLTEDSLFQMIPWDLSESYIGAIINFNPNVDQLNNYDAYAGYGSFWTPLVSRLTSDPESVFGKIYTAHLRTIIKEQLNASQLRNTIDTIQDQISDDVFQDPNRIFSNQAFRSNVSSTLGIPFFFSIAGILSSVEARIEYFNENPELQKMPPQISEVQESLEQSDVIINCKIENATSAKLMVTTSPYNSFFVEHIMNDNGIDGDAVSEDGIYSCILPHTEQNMDIKYYIKAENDDALILSPERAEYEFYIYRSVIEVVPEDLVINELLASNQTIQEDQNGSYDDWIELYNNSDTPIDLSGYHLSDDSLNIRKWSFPDTIIEANDYLIVWADNDAEAGLHANFKLSRNGESIILSNNENEVIDIIAYPEQTPDISYGRFPNGTGPFTHMEPSFSGFNSNVVTNLEVIESESPFSAYPNPFYELISFSLHLDRQQYIRMNVYNNTGKIVKTIVDGNLSAGDHTLQWVPQLQNGQLASGQYIIKVTKDDQTLAYPIMYLSKR